MATSPPTVLSVLRQRISRFYLVCGVGFLAVVLASLVVAPLTIVLIRWAPRAHPSWLPMVVYWLCDGFWAYAMLPALWAFLGRIFQGLNPWTCAVGSVVTAELAYLSLDFLGGNLGTMARTPALWIPRLVMLAVAVALSRWVVQRAQRPAPAPAAKVSSAEPS